VPLLAMRQLADPKHPCWLSVGPQLMFLTSARQVYSREDGLQLPNPEYLPEGTVDVAKWYKPFDVMLNVGVTNIYEMRTNDWMRMSCRSTVHSGCSISTQRNTRYEYPRDL
jgi:hypothetical protein